jgi:hypothetical protein
MDLGGLQARVHRGVHLDQVPVAPEPIEEGAEVGKAAVAQGRRPLSVGGHEAGKAGLRRARAR